MVLGRRSFPSTMGDLCWTSSRWSPTWKVEVARYGSHGPGGNRSSNRNESIYSWGEEVKGLCVRSITYKARQKGSFFIFHMFFFWDFSWNFGFWFFWLANGVKWTARYTVVLFLLGLPQSIPPRNKCKKKILYSETNGGELITISIQRCVSSGLTKLSDSFAATLSVKRWLAWEKRHGIHAFEKINRKNQPRLMFEEPSPNSHDLKGVKLRFFACVHPPSSGKTGRKGFHLCIGQECWKGALEGWVMGSLGKQKEAKLGSMND